MFQLNFLSHNSHRGCCIVKQIVVLSEKTNFGAFRGFDFFCISIAMLKCEIPSLYFRWSHRISMLNVHIFDRNSCALSCWNGD